MMKKRHILHWAMGVIMTPLLGSCTTDDVIDGASREECDIMSGQPMTVTSATRANDGRTSSTQFDPGETVWLWANKTDGTEYIKAWQLTAQGEGSFIGTVKYWPSDGSSLNVYALHGNFKKNQITEGTPSSSWSSLSLTHTVETDQTLPENKRLSDLLYSHSSTPSSTTPTAFAPNNPVQLTFNHLLAKITVKLDLDESKGIESSELNNATVKLTNMLTTGIFKSSDVNNIITSGVNANTYGSREDIKAGIITQPSDMNSTAYEVGSAIVPLQQFGGGKNDASQNNVITITLASPDNRSFSYKPATKVALSAGMEYTYTLKIIGNKISGSLSVSPFSPENRPISFNEYFDYLADLENRNYLGSKADPHDLSLDYNGLMNTANCYVVTHPGYYKFPLVYGNAIKNGATNAIAYGVGTGSTTFVNHLDNQITDPYIYNNKDDNEINLVAKSVELLWQDAQNLISNIDLCDDNKYIKFVITNANIQQGNAVIAVKDGSDNIMWSWHIWVTNRNIYATVPIQTVAVSGTTQHTYNFMPVPLGWDDDDDDIQYQPNCPYYQWGRKDPLCPSDGTTSNKDKTLYDSSGNSLTMIKTPGGVSTGTSIQNPTTYYTNASGNYDWNSYTYNDYWNATNGTTTSMNDNAVVKTVYDPNPVGFKMPSPDAFTGFTRDGDNQNATNNQNVKSNWNVENTTIDKGYKFFTKGWKNSPTDFWPANGFRAFGSGSLCDVGSNGDYWSAGPYNSSKGLYFYFHWNGVHPQGSDVRAYGFGVRPVSE